jgi:hypothetical protein
MMRLAIAGIALALSFEAQAADPVAFVADLKGNATIEGDGKVAFLAELAPGTRLLLGTGAAVAVTYASSGEEFTLNGPGEFLVMDREVRAERGVAPARRKVMALPDPGIVTRVSRTASASLRMRGVKTDATAGNGPLEYPVNTQVATLQPMLRWRGEAPADGFVVRLVDASGKEIWKVSVKSASARPSVKLAPATRYTWSVMTSSGSLGEAHFETLPAEALSRAEKSRTAAKSFSDRVMHAFLLQDVGATQDAREAWAALAGERPDLPELAALARQ